MKRSHLLKALCTITLSFIIQSSYAALTPRLAGLAAYDDALDITWLTDAGLSGVGSTWLDQLDWIDSLNSANYLGFNDWRLASMSVSAGLPTGTTTSVMDCSLAITTEEQCKDNELGYMFYYNLGGMLGDNLTGDQTVGNVTLYDIQSFYWPGTGYDSLSPLRSWRFDFYGGNQSQNYDLNRYGWAVRDGDVISTPITTIDIDIKPGSDTNSINVSSSGVIPVAILSTAEFDATTVDRSTVSLAGASVKLVGKSEKELCHYEDVNADGMDDLVCQVYTAQFMVEEGSTSAILEAYDLDGRKLRGEDTIQIVPDN